MKCADLCYLKVSRKITSLRKKKGMSHSSKNADSFGKFRKKKKPTDQEDKHGAKKRKPWARNRMRDWEEAEENEGHGRYER